MATEPSAVEQAISRTLRENLDGIQRTAEELHRAVADLIAACASSRSLNVLPPVVRAQLASASLSATLDVLSRLITAAVQPPNRMPMESEAFRLPSAPAPEPLRASNPPDSRFAEPAFIAPKADDAGLAEPVPSEPRPAEPLPEVPTAVRVPVVTAPVQESSPVPMVVRQERVVPESRPEPRIAPKVSVAPAARVPVAQSPVAQAPGAEPPTPSPVEAVINLVVEAVQNSGGLFAAQDAAISRQEPVPAILMQPTVLSVAEPSLQSVIQPVAVSSVTEDDSLWPSGPEIKPELVAPSLMGGDAAPLIAIGSPSEPASEVTAPDAFDISSLPVDQQELHRRANRVAKVSMQDIRMLRPDDVRLGRENRDLCRRLRDDIEKAHKEYERRFQTINSHPVDYFYNWMVEILAGGESEALGDYPYPSVVLHR